ncbi:hypothetical protein BDV96DRAFT_189386 [Lophiotrema nucula]|uniref:Fungal-specific transcription factor domain-containing protein n=1 Tax=Lophiotrema nucula TaxID=690887 RepID=A0A6A5YWJ9_9PLEO|nr:hypothetical protein BDV96DRAFT_189386 [Lophiotrema nucula]
MVLEDSSFEFIQEGPSKRVSRENKTRIRRKAMQSVGAARRRGDLAKDPKRWIAAPYPASKSLFSLQTSRPFPLSGMELLVRNLGLDPLDLSALSSVHIGAAASAVLYSDPTQLQDVLSCRQKSYFSHVAARFGHVNVLDDAFRCLVIMAHSLLIPTQRPTDAVVLSQYGKALRSLQSAINQETLRHSSEVLCATSILASYEILNSSSGRTNSASWSQHVAGAARLIQDRGPEQFTTDFDRALLISFVYPVCADSFLNNEPCFLDDPSWIQVLDASVIEDEDFSDGSKLGIELMKIMVKLSGLARRTSLAVAAQDTLRGEHLHVLETDIRNACSAAVAWRRKFNTSLMTAEKRNERDDFGKRHELLATELIIHVTLSRMLCAIVLDDRPYLDEEVQNMAQELRDLKKGVENNKRASFFLAQKTIVSDASIATHEIFQVAVDRGKIVEQSRLLEFCKELGRKNHDGKYYTLVSGSDWVRG